jgi:hypothetical protein
MRRPTGAVDLNQSLPRMKSRQRWPGCTVTPLPAGSPAPARLPTQAFQVR